MMLKNEGERARIRGIQPEMIFALMVANEVYKKYGYELTVTSIAELSPGRKKGSRHLSGYAVDLRTRDMSHAHQNKIWLDISEALGPDYDVILESNHIHIEFDPEP